MNRTYSQKTVFTLIVSILCICDFHIAYAMTQITGTITERRGYSVKVEFQPHETAGPAVGDKVEFSTEFKGIKVNAGIGKVTKTDGNAVWVETSDNRPNLKMTGIIQATGKPGPVECVLKTPGSEFQIGSKTFWAQGIVIKINSEYISREQTASNLCLFKNRGALPSPIPDATDGRNPLQFHHDKLKQNIENRRGEGRVELIWQDHRVQGVNVLFYVSQIITTTELPQFSPEEFAKWFPDKKYVKREPTIQYRQSFIITFASPRVTPPRGSISREESWEMLSDEFSYPGEKFEPKKTEKILLEVLKTISVDPSRKFTDPWKK